MNKELVFRLLKYKRVLDQMKTLGFQKAFANNLSDAVGVAPTLVRKDFSLLDIQGNKKGGYQIDQLSETLSRVLGKDRTKEVIIVGCGSVCQTLTRFQDFRKENIKVTAVFDLQNRGINEVNGIPVLDFNGLADYVQEKGIDIGIISVPEIEAAAVLDLMKKAGIRGVLNFSGIELKSTTECIINNMSIAMEIDNLYFHVKKMES